LSYVPTFRSSHLTSRERVPSLRLSPRFQRRSGNSATFCALPFVSDNPSPVSGPGQIPASGTEIPVSRPDLVPKEKVL